MGGTCGSVPGSHLLSPSLARVQNLHSNHLSPVISRRNCIGRLFAQRVRRGLRLQKAGGGAGAEAAKVVTRSPTVVCAPWYSVIAARAGRSISAAIAAASGIVATQVSAILPNRAQSDLKQERTSLSSRGGRCHCAREARARGRRALPCRQRRSRPPGSASTRRGGRGTCEPALHALPN